jgi:hypothetical protein
MSRMFLLVLAMLLAAGAGADDTLRCGSKIVRVGMTEEEVRGYCGQTWSSTRAS